MSKNGRQKDGNVSQPWTTWSMSMQISILSNRLSSNVPKIRKNVTKTMSKGNLKRSVMLHQYFAWMSQKLNLQRSLHVQLVQFQMSKSILQKNKTHRLHHSVCCRVIQVMLKKMMVQSKWVTMFLSFHPKSTNPKLIARRMISNELSSTNQRLSNESWLRSNPSWFWASLLSFKG